MGARGTGTWWCPSFVDEGSRRSLWICPSTTSRPAGGITPTPSSMPSVTAATWSSWATPRGVHCAAGLCPRPRRPRGAARGDDPRTRRALLGLVDQHRLSRERVRGRLLPRRRSRARCRGEPARTGREFRALRQPWPLPTWPEVRTKYLLCREDRMFSAEGHVATPASGSGSSPDEIDVRPLRRAEPSAHARRSTRGLRSRHSVSRSVRQRVTHRARESIRGAAGRGSNRQDPTSARSLRHPIQGTPRARQGLPAGLTVAFS